MIEMLPVDFASRVSAFGYHLATQTLRARLKTGEVWDFPAFPTLSWEVLMSGQEDGDRTLEHLERAARRDESKAARLVSTADELPTHPGARLREMQLRREFGMPGTPSRERHDALVREREAMPVSQRAAELNARLEALRAELAAVTWQSTPGDLAALQHEESAVLHILTLCENAYQEIDAQIEALRSSVARDAEKSRENALASQGRKLADFARLHVLKGLLRANLPPSFFEMDSIYRQLGMNRDAAWQHRNGDWETEVVDLRNRLRLPQEVKPELPPRPSSGVREYDGLREESRRAEDANVEH